MYSPSCELAVEQRNPAMAEDLDDGEFWLPSQFLTKEDILMGFDTSTNSSTGFNSDLGSSIDLVTETESDEDDSLSSGLTSQMARSSLNPKGGVFFGSPQLTLCTAAGGIPTGVAGELKQIGVQKGTGYFDSNRGKQSTPVSPTENPNFHAFQPSQDKLQAFHFQQLWSQEMMNQRRNRVMGLPPASTWAAVQRPVNWKPQLAAAAQNISGSGMRAVFLGPTGSKRESVGTGVFLPRSLNPTEPRKKTNNNNKQACATILVPEKVVQALKNINAQPKSQPKLDSSGRFRGHNNGLHGPRRNIGNAITRSGGSLEIQLPSEWTY